MAFLVAPPNVGTTDHGVAVASMDATQPTNPGQSFMAAPYAGGIRPDTPQTHAWASLTG